MNQEQKFDNIIKKKVDEAEFPFDEQNWNKLSMQLDAERRLATSRGWGKFLFLGLLFLGITSASIALYKIEGPFGFKSELANNLNSGNDNTGSSNAQAHGARSKYNATPVSENNLLAVNNSNNGNASAAVYVNDANLGNTSSNENITETASANTISKTEINTNSNSISVNETNSSELNSVKNNAALASSKKVAVNSSSNKLSKNNKTAEGSNESNSNNDGSAGEMINGSRSKTDQSGEINLEHNVLDRIDAHLPNVYSNRNIKLPTLRVPAWYDDDYHRKGKKRLSFLNAEAGGAFLLGWDSRDGKDGRGLNWYAGVNYGKFLTKKVGFSAGTQFYNIGNIKQPFYESSKSVYGLGSTSSNTVITTQSLFYFSVPLKFYYAINTTHQVGASVNPSFLFSSNNIVENYHLTDDIRSNEMKAKTSGIYEGVRLNNVLVSAFYRAKLNKRIYLNAEVLYGVRDIFKNTSANNYVQKPVGFRLGLQYTLFEK